MKDYTRLEAWQEFLRAYGVTYSCPPPTHRYLRELTDENRVERLLHWAHVGKDERFNRPPPTLKEALTDWTDWDGAAFELACALGLIKNEPFMFQTHAKHVFWSNNPLGNALHEALQKLVGLGILEEREEPDNQFRWNPHFKGSWEE